MSAGEATSGPLSWRRAAVGFAPLREALGAGLLLGLGLLLDWRGAPEPIPLALFLSAVATGGRHFAGEGLELLLEERRVGIEVLMGLAAAGAMVFGLFEEAAALVFLYATAEAIEELTFARTRSAIRGLLELAPRRARVLVDGTEREVAAEELGPEDVFVVRPGESLPTDGVVRAGGSAVDESQVTGEGVPVAKEPGSAVFAGSVNGPGVLEVEATRPFEDNTLQRIVHLVEEAQERKSRTQRLVDRFAVRYSPAVIVAAGALAAVPPLLGGDPGEWALRGVTLLVAAAPCALVISVPIAAAAAITTAGREGILVKGGRQLEALAGIGPYASTRPGRSPAGCPR